jgi:hypothetical protein
MAIPVGVLQDTPLFSFSTLANPTMSKEYYIFYTKLLGHTDHKKTLQDNNYGRGLQIKRDHWAEFLCHKVHSRLLAFGSSTHTE